MEETDAIVSEALCQKPIGETDNFIWFITSIGIVAFFKNTITNCDSLIAENEALDISIDLSKEIREYRAFSEKKYYIYYS